MEEPRDIYDCIKAVNYGNLDFSPDAKEEKQRVLNFPIDTVIDEIIKTHFKKRVNGNYEPEPELEEDKTSTTIADRVINSPDLLNKMRKDEKIKELRAEIEALGGEYDNRWAIPKLQNRLRVLKKKEKKAEV